MTILYLSGPMTGLPHNNFPAFNEAASRLRAHGFTVINPAEGEERATWLEYMRADVKLVADADGIASLPGWQDSRGATIEHALAGMLGLRSAPVEVWTFFTEAIERNRAAFAAAREATS